MEEFRQQNVVDFFRNQGKLQLYFSIYTPPRLYKTEVLVIWGPTGVSKSKKAFELVQDHTFWVKPPGQWFDGYRGQEIAIFDEFSGDLPWELMLQPIDRYPMQVPVKGAFAQWLLQLVVITSSLPPHAWYADREFPVLERRLSHNLQMVITITISFGI